MRITTVKANGNKFTLVVGTTKELNEFVKSDSKITSIVGYKYGVFLYKSNMIMVDVDVCRDNELRGYTMIDNIIDGLYDRLLGCQENGMVLTGKDLDEVKDAKFFSDVISTYNLEA